MCDDGEKVRMKVCELAALARARAEALRAEGTQLHPVVVSSKKLAEHFWGSAWMKQLALCESGGLCLAPGRTLLRHGCVLDIAVAEGHITALVSGEQLCEVDLRLTLLDDERREQLAVACRGHIDSLVSLLEGKVDGAVLERLCDPHAGLLPEPADWRMSCTCPDWAEPCPHAAAAIYAAGCLIDETPSLLFLLRGVEPASLLETPLSAPCAGQPTDVAALSALFDIDIEL